MCSVMCDRYVPVKILLICPFFLDRCDRLGILIDVFGYV